MHVRTAAQGAPSSCDENVEPTAHAAQTRSSVYEPAISWPMPAGHVRQAVHTPAPARANVPCAQGVGVAPPLQECPAGQSAHSRLEEAPAAAVSYSVGSLHVRSAWQTRSLVPVGAACVYCPSGHKARCVEQSRSDDVVGAADSHSSGSQIVALTHGRPSVTLENVCPSIHKAHCRSSARVGDLLWPSPI